MQNEITRDQIRATFLANGFRVKHGRNDLADYVYQAAFALLELHRARIDELEEQLSAIGAGGVEPLRKRKEPTALAARQREIGEAWMIVFTQLLDDYKQCLLDKDFRDARAARSAVIAEYEQAAAPRRGATEKAAASNEPPQTPAPRQACANP